MWDGSVHGHLVAEVRGHRVVAYYAMTYDPIAEQFSIGDPGALENLLARLDILSGILQHATLAIVSLLTAVMNTIGFFLVPRFFVIGSVGAILLAYGFYYFVFFALATKAVLWILLPGFGLVAACYVLLVHRVGCIERGLFAAVNGAMGWTAQS